MISLSRDQRSACVEEAARAPSVHNVQPARWRFLDGDRIALFRDLARAIPVADPSGHDLHASLGAAWEGMVIALARHGVALGPPEMAAAALATLPPAEGCTAVAMGALSSGAVGDPDGAAALTRRACRAPFAAVPVDIAERLAGLAALDARVITDRTVIAQVAEWHDAATVRFMRQRAQVEELQRWLRLTPAHPDWGRDGLTADAMALGGAERVAARVLLRWPALRVLQLVGADALLVSEAPQVRSAAALVAFTPPATMPPFERGRRFYRLWLALERAGLAACPMSAVCDDPAERSKLRTVLGRDDSRALANVLRVGVAPATSAKSPRLPTHELLV